jgi:nicotinamide riboside transporter PnuC
MWSWILAAIGVTGIFFVGRKTIWGWLILLLNECIWIAYALATDQYGFIVMATAYAAVYIKSYIAWKKEEKEVSVSQYEINTHGQIDHRYINIGRN